MIQYPLRLRVTRASPIAGDIRRLEFGALDGAALPPFAAGSHIDLVLPDGMVRQYSLLNDPSETDRYVIAVAREPASRGGSIHLHDHVREGDVLSASDPRCHFHLIEEAPFSVLIAGGIGITPIWAMVQRLQRLGSRWALHYTARTRDHAALLPEIRALRSDQRIETCFSREGDRGLDLPGIVAAAEAGGHFYCCGPARLLESFRAACAHLPSDRVHFEQFTAAAPAALDGGFEVELRRLGKIVSVRPGQSIIDALLAAGISAAYSCREGVCGSCETAVLAGIPDHRDAILTDDERAAGNTMMICCSGAVSDRLVLDL